MRMRAQSVSSKVASKALRAWVHTALSIYLVVARLLASHTRSSSML